MVLQFLVAAVEALAVGFLVWVALLVCCYRLVSIGFQQDERVFCAVHLLRRACHRDSSQSCLSFYWHRFLNEQ